MAGLMDIADRAALLVCVSEASMSRNIHSTATNGVTRLLHPNSKITLIDLDVLSFKPRKWRMHTSI
jgi:hypothetical protein